MGKHHHHTGFLEDLTRFSYHRDQATHEKIHRHLTDINDRITDEDIRNIHINIDSREPSSQIKTEISYTLPKAS